MKVMFITPSSQHYIEPNIFIKSTRLDVDDSFVYLGSILSRDGTLNLEIIIRFEKACKAFGKLKSYVQSDRSITIKVKLSVYEACILSVLLYSLLLHQNL